MRETEKMKYGKNYHVSSSIFNGSTLKFTTIERAPFVFFERNSEGEIVGFSGFSFEIVKVLQEIFNFTYTVEIPQDYVNGARLDNGSWTGIIGMLIRGEVDMAAAGFINTHSRQKVIDFTVPYYEEPTTLLIPPPTEDSKLFACFNPFQFQVWIGLLLVVGMLPLIMWGQLRFLWNLRHSATDLHLNKFHPSLFRQYHVVFGILSSQSGQAVPSLGYAPRFLLGVWCLCAMVFIYVYVGILVSFLSIPKLLPLVDSLEDLPISGLDWGVKQGSAQLTIFTEAKEGIFRTIGDKFQQNPSLLVDSDAEGVIRVIKEKNYIYIKGKTYLEFALQRDFQETGQCRLSLAKGEFLKSYFAFALPKNSPLSDVFNPKIQRMIDTGLADFWRRKYMPPKSKCSDPDGHRQTTRKLTLRDLQSAFFILGVGALLALLAFIGERFIHLFNKIHNQ